MYLQNLRQFHVSVNEQFEVIRDSGQRIHYSDYRDVTVRRPNKIYSDVSGDMANRRFWYDGKTVTLLEKQPNLYSQIKAPATIDGMLDFMHKRYGLHVPLSDLVVNHPYQDLTENVKTGTYLGVHMVDRSPAHHLAFTQDNVDWQVWVDAGAAPLPRKVIITYKQQPGQPDYQATLYNWIPGGRIEDGLFQFHPPKGAQRIEFVPPGGQPHHLRKPAS
jgi:hypothetical protein